MIETGSLKIAVSIFKFKGKCAFKCPSFQVNSKRGRWKAEEKEDW